MEPYMRSRARAACSTDGSIQAEGEGPAAGLRDRDIGRVDLTGGGISGNVVDIIRLGSACR